MSIESMAIALHHSRAKGTAKLILLGIANHDGDGGAWPAVATLARYAGISDRRRIQRALVELEGLGEIKRIISQGGDHSTADHRRPNLYRFLLKCPHDCDRSNQHRTARSVAVLIDPDTDGAVVRPPAAIRPPRGQGTAGGGGHTTAQTTQVTIYPKALKSTTEAAPSDRCPSSSAGHLYGPDDICTRCALHRDQYMLGSDIYWREAAHA